MRTSIMTLVVVALAQLGGGAQAAPADPVRGYFAALDSQDFARALALTDGRAQASTSHMVSTLRREAAARHARVEVKVTRLSVEAPGVPLPGVGVPVPVQFHIDVVGHKWCFRRVARTLDGTARFYVNPDVGRIVAIEGSLD
jgi:hypothetical protein